MKSETPYVVSYRVHGKAAWLGLACVGLDRLGIPWVGNHGIHGPHGIGKNRACFAFRVRGVFRGCFIFVAAWMTESWNREPSQTTRNSGRRFQQPRVFFGFIGFDWLGLGWISLDWVIFSREVSGLVGSHSVVTRKLVRGIGAKGIITVESFAARTR